MASTTMGSLIDEDLDELEVIFIQETFHKNEPIREKPLQNFIPRVVLKDKKRKTKDINGVIVKLEPLPKKSLTERFTELSAVRQQLGVVFDADLSDDESDECDEDFEDLNGDGLTTEEDILSRTTGLNRSSKNKLSVNLAKKLKKKAIANRLGIAYNPSTRLKRLKNKREQKPKSWVEKFGRLLAAKKLLYLPLLFRKYKMGPQMSREELDIEIDLYMAEVRKSKKMKLAFGQVLEEANGTTSYQLNSGIKVVKPNLFGGFGGPGWKKRISADKEEKPDKEDLDMELEVYMANKGKSGSVKSDGSGSKDKLDMELEEYMAAAKKKPNPPLLVNGVH